MTYVAEVLADSPFAYWRMGSAYPIHDEINPSTSARDLVLPAGGLTAVTGAILSDSDQARQFSGLTDGTSFAARSGLDLSATAGTPLTFEAWVWVDAYANDDKLIMEFGSSWFSSDGTLQINPNNSNTTTEANAIGFAMRVATNQLYRVTIPRSAMSAAAWHHLVVVYTPTVAAASAGTAIKVYVDGASVTTTGRQNTLTTASSTFKSSGTLQFMSRSNTTFNLAGRLDEIAVYKSELSSGRVAAHYAAGIAAPATPPVNTVAPAVTPTGSQVSGTQLAGTDGTWTGTAPITFAYQWQSSPDGSSWTNVSSGGTSSTFSPGAPYEGLQVRLRVTATNAASSVTANSNAVTVTSPAPGVPSNSVAPVITPTVVYEDDVISFTRGTWTESPTGYSWAVKRNGATVASGTFSASTQAYVILAADVGQSIKVTVGASNATGAGTADSNTITPLEPPTVSDRPRRSEFRVPSGNSWQEVIFDSRQDRGQRRYYPEDYGAARDGVLLTRVTMASGQTHLTSPDGQFVATAGPASGDEGKSILVQGAGASGVDLKSTISSVVSATEVVLANAAVTSVAYSASPLVTTFAVYGTDDTAALKACYADAVNQNRGASGSYYAEIVHSGPEFYVAAGAPTTGGANAGNAQIPVPLIPETETKFVLRLTGPVATGWNHWEQLTPQVSAGSILSMMVNPASDATYGDASVIGGPSTNNGATLTAAGINDGWSNMLVILDGVKITAPKNPGVIAMDLYRVAQVDVRSFMALGFQTAEQMRTARPTNTKGVGIRLPKIGNNDNVTVYSLGIQGFYYGFNQVDHLAALRIATVYCNKASYLFVAGGSAQHGSTILNWSVEGCATAVEINGSAGLKFPVDWTIHTETGSAADIVDTNNQLTGTIKFASNKTPAAGRPSTPPVVTGGASVTVVDSNQGPGAAPVTPTYAAGTPLTNPFFRNCAVTLGSGVTDVAVDGQTLGVGAGATVIVPPNKTITPTGAGSWKWTVLG